MNELLFRESLGVAAIVCYVIWLISVFRLRIFWQLHHSWWGVGVMLLAVYLGGSWEAAPLWMLVLGFLLLLDDAYQHLRQLLTGDLSFRSPCWHIGRAFFYEPIEAIRGKMKFVKPTLRRPLNWFIRRQNV